MDDPANQVLQCRAEHSLIEAKKARHHLTFEFGAATVYVYERWSDELADFEEITRTRVVVDKKRGHLVPEENNGIDGSGAADIGIRMEPRKEVAPLDEGPANPGDNTRTHGRGGAPSLTPEHILSPLDECCRRLMILSYQFDRLEAATDEWRWQVGECMNDMERIVGAEEVNGYLRGFRKEKTLMQYAWVASKVTRVIGLSWSHHRAVAALPPSEQRERLEEAKATGTPAEGLRLALREPRERHACPDCGAEHQVKT